MLPVARKPLPHPVRASTGQAETRPACERRMENVVRNSVFFFSPFVVAKLFPVVPRPGDPHHVDS